MLEKLMKRIGYVKHSRLISALNQRDQMFLSIKKICKNCPSLWDRVKMKDMVGEEIELKGVLIRSGDYETILVKYPMLESGEVIADHVWVRGVENVSVKDGGVVRFIGRIYIYNGNKYGVLLREFL